MTKTSKALGSIRWYRVLSIHTEFYISHGSVMRPWFWFCLIAGVVGTQVYLWVTPLEYAERALPLGIPGEWVWHRIPSEPDVLWNLIGVAVAGALYVAFVEAGAGRLAGRLRVPSFEAAAWMSGLVAVAFVWLWVVQETAPTQNRIGKSALVLFYPGSSGYFTKARYEAPDPVEFLAGYEDLMRERDVLHVGTHPPGLFLIFHGLIELCQYPPLASFLDVTQSTSFREACDVVSRNSAKSATPLLLPDRRVLWMATMLVLLCASFAVLPLFGLVRRTRDVVTAWRAAAMWPAIPALAIFSPKSDVAYAFVGLLIVMAWLAAIDRRSVLLALLSGFLVWCGLMLSLAFLPVILFAAMIGWQRRPPSVTADGASHTTDQQQWSAGPPPLRSVAGAAVGFLVPVALLWCCYRINMLSVWWLNYQNHAAFYAKYSRTYWQWLLVNPLELVFAAGWPLALVGAAGLCSAIRSRRLFDPPVAMSMAIVWGTLWLTGKNSGEAARLWIIFLPWLVWLAATYLPVFNPDGIRRRIHPLAILLALQIAACAVTVTRVSGFDFPPAR